MSADPNADAANAADAPTLAGSSAGGSRAVSGLQPGQRLGGFRIERLLGRGGMGEVYLGHDQSLDRHVAIKTLRADSLASEEALARLKAEARAAARLSQHPNIVTVHALGEEEGLAWVAFEFIEGQDVARLLRDRKRFDAREALAMARQAALALRFAAGFHIVHRDIKPANLMVAADGAVKVADFGLARRLDVDNRLTTSAMVVGTPSYMSPEQALAMDVDPRSDIYSLGCTIYHMVTGETPFNAPTAVGVLHQHVNEPLPPRPELLEPAGGRLWALLQKMTAKAPGERHRDWDEVIAEMDDVLLVLDGFTIGPPPGRRGRWTIPAAGVLLVAGVAAGVLWWQGREGGAPSPLPAQPASAAVPIPAALPEASPVARTMSFPGAARLLREGEWDAGSLLLESLGDGATSQQRATARELQRLGHLAAGFEADLLRRIGDAAPMELYSQRGRGVRLEGAEGDMLTLTGIASEGTVRLRFASLPATVKVALGTAHLNQAGEQLPAPIALGGLLFLEANGAGNVDELLAREERREDWLAEDARAGLALWREVLSAAPAPATPPRRPPGALRDRLLENRRPQP